MITLDQDLFKSALRKSPYKNITALSQALGIHRNTIHYYLSGVSIIPQKLEHLLTSIGLNPLEALKRVPENTPPSLKSIAALTDTLHQQFPHITIVLFGSRARGSATRYADWDLGIYSNQGICHKDYQQLQRIKSDFEDESPYFIDLVNLNRADDTFLENISRDWMFLTGSQTDWINLNEKYNQHNAR